MEININLYSDFINLNLKMIADLKNNGIRFEDYENWKKRKENTITELHETSLKRAYEKCLVFDLANWLERIPDPIPRIIHKCKKFSCPKQYQAGLGLLEKKIKNGDNLFPHLSREIYDTSQNDRMLFTLGITHFHLGTQPSKPQPPSSFLTPDQS